MRAMLRTAIVAALACAAALILARSCSSPPPVVVDAVELHRIETERARLAEEVAREHAAIDARARELAGLELYDRIEVLVPPAPMITKRPENARKPVESHATTPITTAPDPARCHPTGDGWARCPEAVLDRLTLRVIAAESDRDSARLDLDAERAYRRMDADAAAVREAGYLAALDAAKPPAAWKVPAAVVSGAAVATGVALAVGGEPGAGAIVGGAGLVLGVVAVW